MSGRFGRLFRRYSDHHLRLRLAGPALTGPGGEALGRVERIALDHGFLRIEGHARAERVAVTLGGRRRATVPEPRPGGLPGFSLALPFAPGTPMLELTLGGGAQPMTLPLPAPSALHLRLGRLGLLPGFVLGGIRALPPAIRWFRYRDPGGRDGVRRALGLDLVAVERRLDPGALPEADAAPDHPAPALPAPLTVILPVYGAHDLLAECLDRLARHTELPWRLIVLDDASPDPRIRPMLHGFAAGRPAGQVEVIENTENLGFIGTVNRGLARAMEAGDPEALAPVVLLNSDALLPAGWAGRLLAPLLAAPGTVASVTPMSNDAELVTLPVICSRIDLTPGEADALDAAARRFPPGTGLAEAPTGVGFCMALNPRFLAKEPLFDTAFGRGYGEEVDWCRKVAAWGGRHVCQPGLVVEHRGGTSFGSEEKRRLLQKNGEILSGRYPTFDAEVQQFLAEDPLLTPRLALGLAFAAIRAGEEPVPVYLGHAIGGGAEHWLEERIAGDIAATGGAVVLRVGGALRWQVELHMASGVTLGGSQDRGVIERLLGWLPARRVIYSCGVGDPDPIELPGLLLALSARPRDRLEVMIHDFFPLSPSYTLLGSDGLWRGLPPEGSTDRAHQIRRPDGSRASLADWRAAWAPVMARAERVVAFSGSSRDLVAAAYPDARIELRPHRLRHAVPKLPDPAPGAPPVIGVLGNIGAHKGAGLLAALSRRLAASREAKLVLVGNLDPAFRLKSPARVHGSYDLADLPAIAARYGIDRWLIPSVWPETFSYATHEAIATGLPVWCLDLGAQGEAVAASGRGGVIPLRDGRADPETVLAHVLAHVLERPGEAAAQ